MPAPKFAFCPECGTGYASTDGWPRTCGSCQHVQYRNAMVVGVALIPVEREDGTLGILGVKRAIEPRIGHWALPGGFSEYNESLELTAVRETREETGLDLPVSQFYLSHSVTTPSGQVLLFVRGPVIQEALLKSVVLSDETAEVGILEPGQALAFPLHEEAMNACFEDLATPHVRRRGPGV